MYRKSKNKIKKGKDIEVKNDIENVGYIFLTEATEFCGYSQEYLSLRARQGRLKAIKIGRNWATKREWIKEYLSISKDDNKKHKADNKAKESCKKAEKKEEIFESETIEIWPKIIETKKDILLEENSNKEEREYNSFFEIWPKSIRRAIKNIKTKSFLALPIILLFLSSTVQGMTAYSSKDFYVFSLSKISSSVNISVEKFLENEESFEKNVALKIKKNSKEFQDKIIAFNVSKRLEGTKGKILNLSFSIERVIKKINKNIFSFVDILKRQFIITEKYVNNIFNLSEKFALSANIFLLKGEEEAEYIFVDGKLAVGKSFSKIKKSLAKTKNSFVSGLAVLSPTGKVRSFEDQKKFIKNGINSFYPTASIALEGDYRGALRASANSFIDYGKWIDDISKRRINNSKSNGLSGFFTNLNNSIKNKISQSGEYVAILKKKVVEKITGIPKIVIEDFSDKTNEKISEEIKDEIIDEEIVEEEVVIDQTSKTTEKVVVEKITETVPSVRVIEKEVGRITEVKIDNTELSKVKTDVASLFSKIANWTKEINNLKSITQKIQANSLQITHSSAPVNIASLGIQVGGNGIFDSLNSQIGSFLNLGVGNSLSIGGSDSNDSFVVNAISNFFDIFNLDVNDSSSALSINQDGSGDIINLSSSDNTVFSVDGNGKVVITSTESPQFKINYNNDNYISLSVNNSGDTTLTSVGDLALNSLTGAITFSGTLTTNATMTASTYISDDNDSTVRKTGEEILREMIPIFGYDLPIRCSTSCASPNYATTTRTIEDYPFAAAIAGTTRVHKFIIRYADSTTTASSTFRVRNVTDSTNSDTFEIPASSSTSLDSGNAYISPAVTIPTDTDDWKLDVQIPASSMSLQIYQIFLVAYDQVD